MARGPKRQRLPSGKLESQSAFERRTKGSKSSITITNTDPQLTKVATKARAKKDISSTVRSQITRYLSDYLSEEIPGFGKKTANSQQIKKYTGLTGDVAPDAEVNVKEFEKTTGIKLSQSRFLKDQQAALFETKISGLGSSSGVSFTAPELGRAGTAEFDLAQKELDKIGKKNITGTEAYNFIFKNNLLSGKGEQIIRAMEAKFENLLIVNAYDIEKKGGRKLQFNFIKSPLAAVNLRDPVSFTDYISLRILPRYESSKRAIKAGRTPNTREVVSYRIEVLPKPKLTNSWEYKDITKQVVKAHAGAISSGAEIYIRRRIQQYANDPKNKAKSDTVTDLLAFTESIAAEFKEGGFTPLTIKSELRPPKNLGLKTGKGALVSQNINEKKPQRFISGVQLAQLVQRRLGKTMRKFGDPETPDLTERTGRFRGSVNIIANYRKGVIMYYYNPIYDNLNKYGYNPSDQVGKATREVVQSLYARAFNIVKG